MPPSLEKLVGGHCPDRPCGPLLSDGGHPLKVGFMLPYTGTYALLVKAIDNALRMYVDEKAGKLGGRIIEFVTVDNEAEPAKGNWSRATMST
jgi:ABC-type branched-subunit amino acid transport system substrate-binding protein